MSPARSALVLLLAAWMATGPSEQLPSVIRIGALLTGQY